MMKLAAIVCGPDVSYGPLALFSGSFEEKIEKASRFGYSGIELMVLNPDHLDWESIHEILGKNGVEMVQIVTGELFGAGNLCLVTPSDEVFKSAQTRIRSIITMASRFNAMVNIGRFRGRLDWMDTPAQGYQIAVDRIRQVADWASAEGVKITLEPINRYEVDFIHTAQEGMRFIQDLERSNVGLMMDLFHMNIEDDSIEGSLKECMEANLLWHVHVADSQRRYPGSGHLDFPSILKTLQKIGYSSYLSAELLPLPDPDTAAYQTVRYLKQFVF